MSVVAAIRAEPISVEYAQIEATGVLLHPVGDVQYNNILRAASKNNLTIHGVDTMRDIAYNMVVVVSCDRGHNWKTFLSNATETCIICKVEKRVRGMYVAQSSFDFTKKIPSQIEFRCDQNHRIIVRMDSRYSMCPACNICNFARKKLEAAGASLIYDPDNIYLDDALLRFHCNKLRRDPNCGGMLCSNRHDKIAFSYIRMHHPSCEKYISCNQDFIATASQLKFPTSSAIYCCNQKHSWFTNWQVTSTIRIFEAYYKTKFIHYDIDNDIYFTGLSYDINIAFINCNDVPALRTLAKAEVFCNTRGIRLIVIPKDMKSSKNITHYIVAELAKIGEIREINTIESVKFIRTYIRKNDKMGRNLDNYICESY